MFKKIFTLSVFVATLVISNKVLAEDLPVVAYSGIYTYSGKNPNSLINVNGNKAKIGSYLKESLKKRKAELPFELIFETQVDDRKNEINTDYYSLAFLITRDDFSVEKFEMPENDIYISRNILNIGITAILYQTLNEEKSKKNVIIFSTPTTGYSLTLKGKEGMSQEEINELFFKITKNLTETDLFNKLKSILLEKISGKVVGIVDNKATLNLGSFEGIIEGQIIDFGNNNKGSIVKVEKNQSELLLDSNSVSNIKIGQSFKVNNLKGRTEETYQIIDSKISSAKVKNLFDEKNLTEQVNQWLSDFLSSKGGIVVLPPISKNSWFEKSNEKTKALFLKDDQEEIFEIPAPKYKIETDITGFSSKKLEDPNAVNDNMIFKVWLNIKIPEKNYEKEFSTDTTKSVLKGVQSFEEKTQVFELLHQLTSKIAKEF